MEWKTNGKKISIFPSENIKHKVSMVKIMPELGKVVSGMYHHVSVPAVLPTEITKKVNFSKTWSCTVYAETLPKATKSEAGPDLLLYSLSTFSVSFYFLQLSY